MMRDQLREVLAKHHAQCAFTCRDTGLEWPSSARIARARRRAVPPSNASLFHPRCIATRNVPIHAATRDSSAHIARARAGARFHPRRGRPHRCGAASRRDPAPIRDRRTQKTRLYRGCVRACVRACVCARAYACACVRSYQPGPRWRRGRRRTPPAPPGAPPARLPILYTRTRARSHTHANKHTHTHTHTRHAHTLQLCVSTRHVHAVSTT